MPSLIPTHASSHVVGGLSEYLATSFSLAENTTAASLKDFLTDPEGGMFHGPYVRTRLPYAPATDWEDALGWLPEGFTPYRHQAEAFRRLASSEKGQPRRPEPTLVVTGTGSGKTESFLYPIIDHCLRTIGTTGIKALILYPMNALANDQAARLAELLTTDPKLRGIRAGLYTGEASTTARQTVSDAGLITDRDAMRDAPPDILLTNYKMLDQLLLRGEDRPLWERSATSLQYVVLDEFHTYDGAQGTDVALLLRRMGLTIKALQPEGFLSDADSTRPLGRITPVATSATLGDNNGGGTPSEMLDFAHTIFGEPLEPGAVVRETMLTIPQWREAMAEFTGITAEPTGAPDVALIQEINAAIVAEAGTGAGAGEAGAGAEDGAGDGEADAHSDTVHRVLCDKLFGLPTAMPSIDEAVAAAANNEWILTVLRTTLRPVALGDASASAALTGTGVGGAGGTGGWGDPGDTSDPARTLERIVFTDEQRRQLGEGAVTFLAHTLSEIAYLRAAFGALHGREGKKFPGVETHLWVREVSRIDRAVELDVTGPEMFRWSDNGTATGNWLPACYCRNCGRSGWMTAMQPGDEFVETNVKKIRYQGLRKPSLQRPLIDASSEARTGHTRVADDDSILAWLDLPNAALTTTQPDEESEDLGGVVPVLTYSPDTADEKARQDVCPSCGESDAIRYLGSSVATLLSVAVSNLFGMDELDASEKKSLVFTDSVQDAAHRAGFMQSRARTFAFRGRTNAVTRAMAGGRTTLDKLPALLIASANNDAVPDRARFELLPPWVTENNRFEPFWDPAATTAQREDAERKLARLGERVEQIHARMAAHDQGDYECPGVRRPRRPNPLPGLHRHAFRGCGRGRVRARRAGHRGRQQPGRSVPRQGPGHRRGPRRFRHSPGLGPRRAGIHAPVRRHLRRPAEHLHPGRRQLLHAPPPRSRSQGCAEVPHRRRPALPPRRQAAQEQEVVRLHPAGGRPARLVRPLDRLPPVRAHPPGLAPGDRTVPRLGQQQHPRHVDQQLRGHDVLLAPAAHPHPAGGPPADSGM